MSGRPQQQIEEDGAADDTDHDTDRDFVGRAHDAAENVTS
jgi:hypothetical protein